MKRMILILLLFGMLLSCDSVIWDGYKDVTRGEYIIEPGSIELSGTDYTPFVSIPGVKTIDYGNIASTTTNSDGPDTPLALPGTSTGILPAGTGLASENITDMTAVVSLTGTYYGKKNPVNCLVRSPFDAIVCADYTSITVTRQELSDAMGSSGSASLRVTLEEDGELISSNPVNVRKNIIGQISDTRGNNSAHDTPHFFTVYRGKLYFSSINSAGYAKLFRYNDADNSLVQISDIYSAGNDSPGYLTVYNNRLYFYSIIDSSPTRKLFRYDEALDKIDQVSDTRTGSNDFSTSTINPFAVSGNSLYIVAYSSSNYEKLFKYDDSLNTTVQVPNTRTNSQAIAPGRLIDYNNDVYFSALNSSAYMKLFRYDGTKTEQISDIYTGGNDSPSEMAVYNGSLYFKAEIGNFHTKLFRYNSTTNTITRISNTRNDNNVYDDPRYLTVYNNKLYFSALNSSGQTKLYCYNGSTITQISNIRNGGSDNPQNLAVFNNKLYFSAVNSSGYTKLHYYDGSSIVQVSDTNDTGSDDPDYLTVYNGRLYFSARTKTGYTKLFRLE